MKRTLPLVILIIAALFAPCPIKSARKTDTITPICMSLGAARAS